MSPAARKIALVLLLLFGAQLWLLIGRGQYGSAPRPLVFFAVIALASIPAVYRRVSAALDRLREPSPPVRDLFFGAIFALATAYFVFAGFEQHRQLYPKIHDEQMHVLQTQMLARGRLWMPVHPAAASFESFHIFVEPKYASIYFPGTSLLYVPSVWLGLPYWLMPAMVAGACAALMYRVVTELIDGVAGLLAALLLVSLSEFRYLSLVMMSHSVMVLLGLLMISAWLRWRRQPTFPNAALVGAIGGWAAITRPVDAICWAAPVGVAMMIALRRSPAPKMLATFACVVAGATPFLALQLVQNVGLTGHVFETPYRLYCDLYTPHMSFGFHELDPTRRPATNLLARQMYYDDFTVPAAREHRPELLWQTWTTQRLPTVAKLALPSQLLLILLPCSLLALQGGPGPRWVPLAILPLFIAFYVFFAYLLSFYVVLVAPAVIYAVALGYRAILDALPKTRRWMSTWLTAVIVLLCVRALPEFNRFVVDDSLVKPTMAFDHDLPKWVKPPAIVLYRFNPADRFNGDPVYNLDAAWPDDAPIIRANDLSPQQNRVLFDYYATHQPAREVYLVDRVMIGDPAYRPELLGNVTKLAKSPPATAR